MKNKSWKSLAIVFGAMLCVAACGSTPGSSGPKTGAAGNAPPVDGGGGGNDATASAGAGGNAPPSPDAPVEAPSESREDTGVLEAGAGGAGGDAGAADGPVLPMRVLLYHFSTSVIDTVPAQLTFYKDLLTSWGYTSDDSVDPAKFTDAGLAAYGAVAMINTCFMPFGAGKDGAPQAAALQKFVQRGGGLFGTHCAAVTFAGVTPLPLYNQVFGGQEGGTFFDGTSTCRKLGSHPTIDALPATFEFPGNLDSNLVLGPTTTLTVRCTWHDNKTPMTDVPVSWVRTDGDGRVFYTNFGKVVSDLTDPVLGAKHIVPGLAWILRR
jgi:hypothetical protein